MSRDDERFMREALALARRTPSAAPNPRVGAVVVNGGRMVGRGWHRGAGQRHAETAALHEAGARARDATLYVTLEPCVHSGRVPPCAPRIAGSGVRRVVAGSRDPDERVSGAGFAYLRERGIEVTSGVLDEPLGRFYASYVHHRSTGRPFITLKLALAIDGRLAAGDGSSRWISGPRSRALVQSLRARCDAVLVGAGTVIADDPQLTVRSPQVRRQPGRVIVDGRGRVRPSARVFHSADATAVIVATTARAPHDVQIGWKETGAEVAVLPAAPSGGVDLVALADELGRRGFIDVLCEGGARLATSLLCAGLVQRLRIHHGAVLLGAPGACLQDLGIASIEDAERWRLTEAITSDDDVLTTYEKAVS